MDNDLEMSRDMHSNWECKGKMPMNPFNELADELEYEIALMFVYTNVYGAKIYKDPLDHYTFKSSEHRTPFNETPMVNYQGDLYMGTDEARYEVTKYPDLWMPWEYSKPTEPLLRSRLRIRCKSKMEDPTTSRIQVRTLPI